MVCFVILAGFVCSELFFENGGLGFVPAKSLSRFWAAEARYGARLPGSYPRKNWVRLEKTLFRFAISRCCGKRECGRRKFDAEDRFASVGRWVRAWLGCCRRRIGSGVRGSL